MTIHNQADMFKHAKANKYALVSFDVLSLEMAYGVVRAAEEAQAPVIMAVADVHREYFNLPALAPAVVSLARQATVPIGVHFDHAETLGAIGEAVRAGFTSVMYDGSGQSWDVHLAECRAVADMSHEMGILVEGALSSGSKDATTNPTGGWGLPNDELVAEYLEATAADILAVGEGDPNLDVARIAEIAGSVDAYVSLHGGSALSIDIIGELIDAGLTKCAVFSKVTKAAMTRVQTYLGRDDTNLLDLGVEISAGYAEGVTVELERFRSVGHAY